MGPLAGLRILEFEAIGPVPFCGMLLADMGADVLLVDRVEDAGLGFNRERWYDVMLRGRRSVTLDLKSEAGVDAALALVDKADALLEGFRPGVMERLGLGPDAAFARKPKLVYGRSDLTRTALPRTARIMPVSAKYFPNQPTLFLRISESRPCKWTTPRAASPTNTTARSTCA